MASAAIRYAILSDIHGNLEGLDVVLKDAREQKCTHYVCLGNIVGYSPNPKECLDVIRRLECPVIMGNHDEYCASEIELTRFNPMAAKAIRWTRTPVTPRKHLAARPQIRSSCRIVHHRSRHAQFAGKMGVCLATARRAGQFQFHTHPCASMATPTCPSHSSAVPAGCRVACTTKIKIEVGRKYFINVGSIGQPRDRNPKSSYVVFDLMNNLIELRRVEYDIGMTQKKIRADRAARVAR